jgi:hypothetical protein
MKIGRGVVEKQLSAESLSFRVARTMPEIPHEYIVRSADIEAAYVALFNTIMEHGVCERWASRVTNGISIRATVGNIGR